MFTGIIQAVGTIVKIDPLENHGNGGLHLGISPGSLDISDVSVGDSIAVNGVCLTVKELCLPLFTVDVSSETLQCTYGLTSVGQTVNLEKALRFSDRLGGHLVSGHIDDTGEVVKFERSEGDEQNCLLSIRTPRHLLRYIIRKGSVTVNGVSLTVNRIDDDEFFVNVIPHTLSVTTLNELKPGIQVNLETDMLARYVESLLNDLETGKYEN